MLQRTRIIYSNNFSCRKLLTEVYTTARGLYTHSWCLFFEKNSEMCSYGLRKTTIRKDIHLIHKRLKMGFYTAEVFSAVRIEDEDS